jgi:hypothetical protein
MIIMLIVLGVFFICFFVSILLAPSSVNKAKLENGYTKLEILQIPNIFLKSWYEPQKLFVWKMITYSSIGLLVGFILLYLLNNYGLMT